MINKLLMAIAQLTHLHISIPASAAPPGAVPEYCFPSVSLSRLSAESRRLSFASAITVLGAEPDSEQSPERVPVDRLTIQIHDPVCPDILEEDDMENSGKISVVPEAVLPPPPGFEQFSWRTAVGWGGDPSLFDFSAELPKWFPGGWAGQSRDPPALPISPILSDTPDDSLVTNVGSSRDEPDTPSVPDVLPDALARSSSPAVSRQMLESPPEVVSDLLDYLTSCAVRQPPGPVPRWRLARESPFLSECSSSSIRCFGDGCAFRNTTYRPADYATPTGEFGVPMHHPRFLKWIGLLEMGPGMCLLSLSRDQAMDTALQLHKDVFLMTKNLDILEQYVSCLQGTASKILELGLGPRGFPSEEVAAGAMGPRVRRASIQMEAIGLWCPSLDPLLIP